MYWIIVLAERRAAEWVLSEERMAFRRNARADRLQVGDGVAIYVSSHAHHTPHQDEAQIVSIGEVASPTREDRIEVADTTWDIVCELSLERILPLRQGVAFRPLVSRLQFIRNKSAWPSYMRRTLVEMPKRDFAVVRRAVISHDPESAFRSNLRKRKYPLEAEPL
jgi:hypothetical protein